MTKKIHAEAKTCQQNGEMPDRHDGWYPVAVVGQEGYHCTQGPICTGAFENCPGPHGSLLYGSTCAYLSEETTGCIPNTACPTTKSTKFELETPKAESVVSNCKVAHATSTSFVTIDKPDDATYTFPVKTTQPDHQSKYKITAPLTPEAVLSIYPASTLPKAYQTKGLTPPSDTNPTPRQQHHLQMRNCHSLLKL